MANITNATGTLKHGLKIGEEVHTAFEMRPVMSAQEMFDAEQDASVETPLTFNAALMARQLVRIGSYTGPFTVGLIGTLSPVDYGFLRTAQMKLSNEGNGE